MVDGPVVEHEGAQKVATRRRSRLRHAAVMALLVGTVVLLATVLLGKVPGPVGTAVAVVLPWLGIPLLALILAALVARPRIVWLALVPVLAWSASLWGFLPVPWQSQPSVAEGGVLVASQNVEAGSGTGAESARALSQTGAEVLAFTEIDSESGAAIEEELAESHPYAYRVGTVGVWSRYPILDEMPLELGLGWKRALRVEVDAPGGSVAVYVIHAASVRPGAQRERDNMLAALGEALRDETAPRTIALGDFNAASSDPAIDPITAVLGEVRFGGLAPSFTWPASLPVVRIDHVFQRGFAGASATTTAAGASDHRAIVASLRG